MSRMNHEPSEPTPLLSPDGAAAKRPWHPPALQEIDVVETQFGSGAYAPADTTTYTS
jgi:hypothetical protein